MSKDIEDQYGVRHTRWTEAPCVQLDPTLIRQFISSKEMTLARFEIKQGGTVARHSHNNEQLSWIVSGSLLFRIGEPGKEVVVIVNAGELLIIPAGVSHAVEAIRDSVDFDIFVPPRQDWLLEVSS